jgi:hypothetical protein
MRIEHGEEEASLIVKLHRLFKVLPDTEDREVAVLTKLRDMQAVDKARQSEEHQQAIAKASEVASLERTALRSSLKTQWKAKQRMKKSGLRSLVQETVYDRFWFDRVVAERDGMLERYRVDLINGGNDLEELSFVEA